MAKTAAKKRPPARAKATARSAPVKSRPSAKKPVALAVKAKVRVAPKAVKKPAVRAVAKKAAKPPVARSRKAAVPKPAVKSRRDQPVKAKSSLKKPVASKLPAKSVVKKRVAIAAKSIQKKIVKPAKAAAKTITPPPSPVMNGKSTHGFAKRPAAAVIATRSAMPMKSAVKPSVVRTEPVLVPDSRVATNQKPRKNQAGLGVKELDNFRALLLEKRREILGDMSSMENEALGANGNGMSASPVNVTDMGTDNYEQEFTLGLVEKDRVLLREINNALAKIQNGTYGICEGNGTAIGKPRLEVQPWARYSIEFARIRERNGMGIR